MATTPFKAIRSERVTDAVYRVLRESIVSRKLAPGSKVNVDEIARQLGVSRTPVHEALAVLATDGLVDVQPRRGTFVAELTLQDVAEILDVRRALELLACETAYERAKEDDLKKLEALMRKMSESVRHAADPGEAARRHDAANLEFHQLLVNLSGNRKLVEVYEGLRAHLQIARTHLNASTWLERVSLEAAEHAQIIQALRSRDVTALKSALDAHLRRSSTSLLSDIRDVDVREPSAGSR